MALFVCLCGILRGQDPIGVLEGQILDPAGASIAKAAVTVQNLQTGYKAATNSSRDGSFRFSNLPVGEYSLNIDVAGFAPFTEPDIRVDIGRVVRFPVKLSIASQHSEVSVLAGAQTIDLGAAIGNVISSREAVDLPLNGRDLTQLGLLQPGVAPMTAGLSQAGGIARSGQAFAVNGQRPESNNYLLDGVTNVDSVNGGYAIRTPVDAVTEFRILTSNAPAEYGETSGANKLPLFSRRV
jgi:Carboxypeptidase regulatory-like domain